MPQLIQALDELILDTVVSLVIVIDNAGNIVRANASAARTSGYSQAELTGRPFADLFIAPEDLERARICFWDLLAGKGEGRCEVGLIDRNGSRRQIAWAGKAVLGGESIIDRPPGMPDVPFRWVIATGVDVTDRRAVEDEQRLQRELLQTIFDHIPVMLTFFDPAGHRKVVNRAWEQTLGWTLKEVSKIDLLAEAYPDPEVRQRASRVLASGNGEWAHFQLRNRGGKFIDTAWASIRLSDGSIIGIGQDITARKRDEDALRLSESRLRWMVDSNIIGVMFYHLNGMVTGANDAFLNIIGYTRDDLERGLVRWNKMTPPEYAHLDAQGVADIQATSLCRPFEKEYFKKDGSRVPILIGGTAFDPSGQEGVCFVLDLSQRRAAEEATRQVQERLRLALGAANMIAWDWDPVTNHVIRTGDVQAFYGCENLTSDAFFRLVPPEDIPKLHDAVQQAFAGPGPVTTEFRMHRADGEERWLRDFCTAERKSDGSMGRVFGVSLDITDQRRTEQQLRTLNETLEQRVAERTAELTEANRALREQIAERQRVEETLRQSEAHFKELAERNERLAQEVEHRVRNNLAGLMGLVTAMSHHAGDVKSFSRAIQSRLAAMVHIHKVLAESDWREFDLQRLVTSTLDTVKHLSPCPIDTSVSGPPVQLAPRLALPLTMVLVEWFTNSCKYGAHTALGGRLRIHWEICDSNGSGTTPKVRLHWQERGGPTISRAGKASVGTDLVEGFIRNELRGTCELTYPPAGADHVIEFVSSI